MDKQYFDLAFANEIIFYLIIDNPFECPHRYCHIRNKAKAAFKFNLEVIAQSQIIKNKANKTMKGDR